MGQRNGPGKRKVKLGSRVCIRDRGTREKVQKSGLTEKWTEKGKWETGVRVVAG